MASIEDSALRTGQVAAAAGVNVQTLRYYERLGLLREPDRSLGGHRRYSADTVRTLRVIGAAKRLGFTLAETAELLGRRSRLPKRSARSGLRARAVAKLAEIDAKLAELGAVRTTLAAAIDAGCDDLLVCAEMPLCPISFEKTPATSAECRAPGDNGVAH